MAKLFKDIAGQKRALNILTAHLNSGGFSHAYLFIGREGTGKQYLAREFSRYILCPKHANDDCEGCRKFKAEAHPDFIFIKGDEGIKIEQVRQAIERIGLSPAMSKRKVLLISKAENMGIEAANSLLKTLEEPPADSIIILTTSSEKRLPETIISRSQLIKLNLARGSEIAKILETEFDKGEIERIISLAEGSIGEAKKLLLDGEALKEKQQMIADIGTLLGSHELITRYKIIEAYDTKKRLKEFFDLFSRSVFGSIYSNYLDLPEKKAEIVPSEVSLERRVQLAKKILKINRDLDYNVSLRVVFEEMILKDTLCLK